MKITVNGSETEVLASALPDVLRELGYAELPVATAVNSDFVPASARDGIELAPGDRLEVVAPQRGG